MKKSIYFNSEAEMLQYFNGDVSNIPSNILAIVPANTSYAMFSTSNNQSSSGTMSDQGGYIDSPEEIEEMSYAVNKTNEILEGETEE